MEFSVTNNHNIDISSPIQINNDTSSRMEDSPIISLPQTPSSTPSYSNQSSFYKRNTPSAKTMMDAIDLITPNDINSPLKSGMNNNTIDLSTPSFIEVKSASSTPNRRRRPLIMSSPSDHQFSSDESVLNNERLFINKRDIFADSMEERNQREEMNQREETDEERRRREAEEESEALARQLMAEEAMASYAMSSNFLQDHADDYTQEDLAALRAIMAEENPEVQEEEEVENESTSEDLSYETLLQIGERIGDVKAERWALVAREKIEQLPKVKFTCRMSRGRDENDCAVKCLVCQCPYEEGESLRRLPCNHFFHEDCIDQWLLTKDTCPYCRVSIVA